MANSSDNDDPSHYMFTMWCCQCGHQFHSLQHGRDHLRRCRLPHVVYCGCCGQTYDWKQLARHVSHRGALRRPLRYVSAPAPRDSRYNVSCTTPEPLAMPPRYHPYLPPSRHFLPSAAASVPPPASPPLSAHSYIPLASSPSTSAFTATLTLSPPSDSHPWMSPVSPPVSLPDISPLSPTITTTTQSALDVGILPSSPFSSLDTFTSSDMNDLFNLIRDDASTTSSLSLYPSDPPIQPFYSPASPAPVAVASASRHLLCSAQPASATASSASSALPRPPQLDDDRDHLIAALCTQLLWLADMSRHPRSVDETDAIDQAGRRLIHFGRYWLAPLHNPMSMSRTELLNTLTPVWHGLLERYRS